MRNAKQLFTEMAHLEGVDQLIQFSHPEKLLAGLPGVGQLDKAALFGLDELTYERIQGRFLTAVHTMAISLLADAQVARCIDSLPFAPGDVVVGLGDSITDDAQSWFEILRFLLARRRFKDDIRLINAGVSGDTTGQLLARFAALVELRPNWIICLAGTNDARRHGPSPWNLPVGIEETAKNLSILRNWAQTATTAQWVWITPPPVISEQIAAHRRMKMLQLQWYNSDLEAIRAFLRQQPEPVVDLQRVFGQPPHADLLLDDGLHPSLIGQSLIVRALLARLTKDIEGIKIR